MVWIKDVNKCRCISCNSVYTSYQDDYGKCRKCNLKEIEFLIKIHKRQNSDFRRKLTTYLTSQQKEEVKNWYHKNKYNFAFREAARLACIRKFKINIPANSFDKLVTRKITHKKTKSEPKKRVDPISFISSKDFY